MNDSITLRRVVRETMQQAASRKWTIKALHALLRGEFPEITDRDVNAAMMWNQSRGFVDYQVNDETGAEEWKLTTKGRQAE